MFEDSKKLIVYISTNANAETRFCEFKSGMPWDGDFRYTVVRAILAMSNVPGGGYVIIGVGWNDQKKIFEPIGMTKNDVDTYDHETVLEFANLRADPSVQINLKQFEHDSKWFVAIEVSEFIETPVICKKSCANILEEGRIYTRTFKKPESSPNMTYVDMREITDLAADKGLRNLLKRLERAGVDLGKIGIIESDQSQFEKEREDFG